MEQTYNEVKRMFTYSGRILFNDYYRKIGLEPGKKFVPAPKPEIPAEAAPAASSVQ